MLETPKGRQVNHTSSRQVVSSLFEEPTHYPIVPKLSSCHIKPLRLSYSEDRVDLLRDAIKSGFPINSMSQAGRTTLHLVCESGDLKIVELLVGLGADIEKKDRGGRTSVDIATHFGHIKIVEFLKGKVNE
jgi:hypothetical protein